MPKRTGDYDDWFIAKLTDPRIAADYINAAVREHPDNIKTALANVAKARTMKKVAEEAGVARESLYVILSEAGNPTLGNLNGVLKALGLKIQVAPIEGTPDGQSNSEVRPRRAAALDEPPDTKEVLGRTAKAGITFDSGNLIGTGQTNVGFTLDLVRESLAQSGVVQYKLEEERGQPFQWNPTNLPQVDNQNYQNASESLMSSSTKPTPTTYFSNQPLGT